MKLFCNHKFRIIKTTYAKPLYGHIPQVPVFLAEKLIFGITTVLLKCYKCTKTRQEKMYGKDRNKLI